MQSVAFGDYLRGLRRFISNFLPKMVFMVLVIRKYTFPFGVRVKAYWCMQQVLLLHVWKALSTPTFGFDGSKDPKSDTQSLLSTFWPSLGLLVFYCPKASKSGFYLRLFLR